MLRARLAKDALILNYGKVGVFKSYKVNGLKYKIEFQPDMVNNYTCTNGIIRMGLAC